MNETVAKLVKKYRKDTKRDEYALVSKKDPTKILKWFGVKKPSKESVLKQERRVQYFKHIKGSMSFLNKIAKTYQVKASPSFDQFVKQVEKGIEPSEIPLSSKEYDEVMKECFDNKWSVQDTIEHFNWLKEDNAV